MTEKTFISTFIYIWPYILIVSIITYFVTARNWDMAVNFFLGGATSVMLMSHNYKTTMKTAQKEPDALQKRAVRNYFFRYGFYILILTITFLRFPNDVMYLIPVFIGFTSFKIVMLLNFFITKLILTKKGVDFDD